MSAADEGSAAAGAEPDVQELCLICYDKFSLKVRKQITCPKCQKGSCAKCIQTYMMNSTEEPHCPNCRYGWTRGFLYQNLPKTFLNGEWAAHRRQILWQREKAYLPDSQVHAERVLQSRKMTQDMSPLLKERQELMAKVSNMDAIIRGMQRNIYRLSEGLAIEEGGATAAPEHRQFIRRCTHPNCQGFLSTAWKCGICDNYTCNECLVVKGQERNADHTCKPDDLATAKLIAKDTKPCPNCGEGIYRAEGCSHMFCTSCKTAFNWNTGKIQKDGYIDNPHYFAYMQATRGSVPRAPGDEVPGPCNQLPSYNMVEALASFARADRTTHGRVTTAEYEQATTIRNVLGHAHGYWRESYNSHTQPPDTNLLRVQFLLNEINKETIERQLMNTERKRERHRAIYDIIDTFTTVGSDIFRRYEAAALAEINSRAELAPFRDGRYSRYIPRQVWLTDKEAATKVHAIWTMAWCVFYPEFLALREYCCQALRDVSKDYGCTVPYISDTYRTASYNHKTANRKPRARAGAGGPAADTVSVSASQYPDTDSD